MLSKQDNYIRCKVGGDADEQFQAPILGPGRTF